MVIFFSIFIGICVVVLSRLIYGKWFNHVSLYTAIWSGSLALFELRLINYYPLELETWVIIISCWLIFLVGSFTVTASRLSIQGNIPEVINERIPNHLKTKQHLNFLKNIIWSLNWISLLAALYNLYLVSKLFGGLTNAFILGNLVYSYRVSEGIPGSIPYIAALVYTAALLAGNYTAMVEKLKLVAIMPLIIIIIIDFTNMGRVDILVVSIFFASSYFMTPKSKSQDVIKKVFNIRKFVMVLIILAIVIAGAELVRTTRQAKEGFIGSTKTLQKLSSSSIITPSIYLYLTSDYGILNQYFKKDKENTPIGGHTFLPLYRIFERLGIDIHADTFQEWYRTPTRTNTGTYLRELHGDFGLFGLLLGPYILGFLSTIFWNRLKKYGYYRDLSIVGFLFGIIGMSFFVMPTRISPFFFYLPVSFVLCFIIDKKIKSEEAISKVRYYRLNPTVELSNKF